jgi:hypothetical protein
MNKKSPRLGRVAERLKASALKAENPQGFVGSNPTPSESEKLAHLSFALGVCRGLLWALPKEHTAAFADRLTIVDDIIGYVCYGIKMAKRKPGA